MRSDAESDRLTQIQREILHAIRHLARRNGHAPCMREVLSEVRLRSTSALSYQYRELIKPQGILAVEGGATPYGRGPAPW
jgi:SOS-response transcriptional repressor LexA